MAEYKLIFLVVAEWPLRISVYRSFLWLVHFHYSKKGCSNLLPWMYKQVARRERVSGILRLLYKLCIKTSCFQPPVLDNCYLSILSISGIPQLSSGSLVIRWSICCRNRGCSLLHTAKCVPTPLSALQLPKQSAYTSGSLHCYLLSTSRLSPWMSFFFFFNSLTDFLTGLQGGEKGMKKVSSPYLAGSLKIF